MPLRPCASRRAVCGRPAPGSARLRRGAGRIPRRRRCRAEALGVRRGFAAHGGGGSGVGGNRLRRPDRAAHRPAAVGPPPPRVAAGRVYRRRHAPEPRRHRRPRFGRPPRATGRHRHRPRGRSRLCPAAAPMDPELILAAPGVRYRYPGADRDALDGVSLTARGGELVAVLGPNGSGKTTLLRVAPGALAPTAGSAAVAGRPAADWTRRELARLVGVVPQREETVFPQRVREAVLLGRYPHLSMFGAERRDDHEAVDRALAQCDAGHLTGRWMATLSGGEYQRVRVARALAQEPRLLVLDEPTMSLDVRHEMELFELVRGLVDRSALAVVLVTHHVNLAARFADRVLLLDGGRAAGEGVPAEVLTRETVERVFAWPVAIATYQGAPQMIPLRRRSDA